MPPLTHAAATVRLLHLPQQKLNCDLKLTRDVRHGVLQAKPRSKDVYKTRPRMSEHAGSHILAFEDLSDADRDAVRDWYHANVFPILTPLAVDPGHRFPFISNLSENLGVLLESPGAADDDRQPRFGRVIIPAGLPQFVDVDRLDGPGAATADTIRLVPLDAIIAANLSGLFPGLTVRETLPFRVTRNAALEIEDDEVDDLLEQVEAELRLRRFASALRLQVNPDPPRELLRFITEELDLTDADVYHRPGPLAFVDLFQIASVNRPDLKFPPYTPAVPPALRSEEDIFSVIRRRDVLVHHPYESFEHSVERFIEEAAQDPGVLAIKQTIYRTTRDSPFIDSLIAAAENGKQVACLVELRARFDEERNVTFARQLEKAGVHVAYGVVGLKTHSKCSLVVRRERAEDAPGHVIRSYCHLGTGNYHPATAQLYTDLGLLTCDPALTADVIALFNALTGHAAEHTYNELLVAPTHMRARFNQLIDREIDHAANRRPARILAKMNSLEDRKICQRLLEASQAGVQVTLIVRGFCSLRPGVPGVSDNIEVISVVGRLLEHSRIFGFANGHHDPAEADYYIGSADWMYRNLDTRVEAITPVKDPAARASLWEILDVTLRDRRNAWRMRPDGGYDRLHPPPDAAPDAPETIGTFRTLMARAATPTPDD